MASFGQIQSPVDREDIIATSATTNNAVELSDLNTSTSSSVPVAASTAPMATTTPTTVVPSSSTPATIQPSSSTAPPSALSRLDSVAIGPSTDEPITVSGDEANPVCNITLLLGSGARHPYKLDERYLTKRGVATPGVTEGGKKDPFSISVYTLKELILREWREEWEAKPSSPSSIRLIHFGRLLDDKMPLKDCKFNLDTPNVVHMSIKPQDIVDEEEASKGKALRGERDGSERTPGCRCVIM